MKRLISLALCFLMIVNVLPVKAFAEEEQSLEEIIRPQIEAFAKSIDQKDADGKAQDILISHGISGGGKKLSVGKSSALTATLMNSELAKEFLTVFCAELIRSAEELNMNEIFGLGALFWQISGTNCYYYKLYDYNPVVSHNQNGEFTFPKDQLKKVGNIYFDKTNGYDKSLKMLAGGVCSDIDLRISEIYDDKIIYDFSVTFMDVFNFDTDNSSTIEDLLGFIGMLLFNPYVWEAKCNFQIEIPIEKPEENKVFGDMDGSGNVDVMDAYFARLVAAGLAKPTDEQLMLCDVDSDGKITAIDANIIRKFAAGIIKSLPIN